MLKEILTARTRPSDKALYNIWARKISDGWTETTITGSLPLTFRAKGDTLTDYTVHGTSAGAGARTENLFDKSTALTGYEISGSSIAENPLWFVTDYIKVDPQTSYIAPKSSWGTGCLEYASKGGEPTKRTFNNITGITTLSTTQYIRLNSTIATIDSKMVVQGSTAPTTFIPYGYEIPLTLTAGQHSDDYALYIGDTQLGEDEYLDYAEQKVYKRNPKSFVWLIGFQKADDSGRAYYRVEWTETDKAVLIGNCGVLIKRGIEEEINIDNYETKVVLDVNTGTYYSARFRDLGEGCNFRTFVISNGQYLYGDNIHITYNEIITAPGETIHLDRPPVVLPTNPPAPFPAISAYQGENTLSSTETLGSVSVSGKIKEVTP